MGKLKLNTLLVAVEVASSVIVAVVPASVVVTVPIFIAGVVPSVPSSPDGIVKSNILFVVVDEGETETGDKGVVVLPNFLRFYLFSEGLHGARLPCFWSQSLVRGVLPRSP